VTESQPRPIREAGELDTVLREPVAILYKHSPLCGSSAAAARQVRTFMDAHPDVPVYLVDVIRDRPLAREVTRRLGIRHESPQALVLRTGDVVWTGSHTAVTADQLGESVNGARTPDTGGER